MKKNLLVILSVLAFFNLVKSQCLLSPVALPTRLSNSSLIIEGTVLSQKSFWNAEHNYVFTSNLIDVYKVFKGSSVSFQVEVITDGGEVGLFRQVVDPSLQLQVGQTGVFVLNVSNNVSQFGKPVYNAYADAQGFIKYDASDNTARDPFNSYPSVDGFLYPLIQQTTGANYVELQARTISSQKLTGTNSVAAVTGFAPTSITAGTASTLTITGTGFGATQGTSFVEFPDADAGAGYVQPHATQYLSWSPTQIVVQVPTKTTSGGTLTTSGTAGTGQIRVNVAGSPTLSAQTLTVNYGHLNVYYTAGNAIYNTRHVDLNGIGGITWQMFTGFNANAPAKAAFQRAFQTWRCATLINWALGPTVATNTITFDGVDVIRFDVGAELPVGVLGRCTSYFSGCITGTLVNFYVSELDICFDDATNWQYGPAPPVGPQYDFESVTLHELGHGHQLSHVINNADVMHYSIANATSKRVLNVDDINGGNAVMTRNLSGGVCGKATMVALSPTNCAVGTPTAAYNITPSATVCTGQVVFLTDASAGSPTSWAWTMTGGVPATATVQNTATVYNTAGTYTVSLIATNGFGSSAALVKTITVVATPTVAVSSSSICSGSTGTLVASGATTYTWNPGGVTGTTQTFTPASTTIYTVTGANGTCTNSATGTLSVIPTPTLTVPAATICAGSTATITASGATTYTWNPGALIGATQNLSPAITTTYTVTGNSASCSSTKTTVVTVIAVPVLTVTGTNTLCSGSSTTLTASGAATYTWNPGGVTGTTQTFTPASTTTYTVTGSNGTCSGVKNYTVTVNPTPTIAVTSASICAGSIATLTASGATTYTWNPGGLTGTTQTFSPAGTTNYTVNGTSGTCSSSQTATITVTANPTVAIAGTNTICSGKSTTLTASGATNYTWNPGAVTGAVQVFTPASSIVYTVVGTTGICSNTRSYTVTVNPTPTVAVAASNTFICIGQSSTLTASGASTYTFNPGGVTINPATFSPTVTTTYIATGSSAGCTNTAAVTVTVSTCIGITQIANTNPTLKVYPNPTLGMVTVEFGEIYSGKITLYNAIGQETLNKNVNEIEFLTLDLSSYSKGIYLVKLKAESGKERILKVIRD